MILYFIKQSISLSSLLDQLQSKLAIPTTTIPISRSSQPSPHTRLHIRSSRYSPPRTRIQIPLTSRVFMSRKYHPLLIP